MREILLYIFGTIGMIHSVIWFVVWLIGGEITLRIGPPPEEENDEENK